MELVQTFYFRSLLEAAANAEALRDKYACGAIEIRPTEDGAVLILKECKECEDTK